MAWLRGLLGMAIIGGVALGLGAAAGGLGMTVAALALGLNLLAFVPAAALRTERFYDLVGSLTFTAIVFYVVNAGSGSERVFQVGCAILLWAARLGSFLVRRVRREGGDGRFDEMKVQPARFLLAWCMQALWASTTTLSLVALDAAGGGSPALGLGDLLGGGIWLLGFGLEVLADRQKEAFKQNPANRGRFIQGGLWSRCQHPNYLGEILLWVGLFVVAAPHLSGAGFVAVLSPLFITLLLTRVSGIPLLQQRAKARWGHDPDFQRYQRVTPLLLPIGPRPD